ncbi:GNAT family N-acetyltransferase [Bacteroidota bacterium]
MEIKNLTPEYNHTYFVCLENWSEEMKESGDHKEKWFNKMKERRLGVKIAVEEDKVCGMIQYIPIEESFVIGKDLYLILCIWVHGYKKGIGNHQKRGIGKTLIRSAEEDVRSKNAKGMAAWGISLPFWMKASWFRKQGYQKVDKDGTAVLLWKPFGDDAIPPRWIKKTKEPEKGIGVVNVTGFINGWCPAQNLVFERAKKASSEFGEKVKFEMVDTSDRETYLKWSISDALYIDSKRIRTGPPPSYEKIRKLIAKRVKKLKGS